LHGTGGAERLLEQGAVCGRTLRQGPDSGCRAVYLIMPDNLGHGNPPAERWLARPLSEIWLSGHAASSAPIIDGGLESESATGDNFMGGMHPLWGQKCQISWMPVAARQPADADLGSQSDVAKNRERSNPERSGMEQWRLPESTSQLAAGCTDAFPDEQQPGDSPESGPDA
jgi:hypothetical protein